ncbi:MAG: hypothetical protein ISQ53_01735 [Synechococcus sp. BS307-5m-G39]|nr:hypothetical protein [Synechococcus sp. BS307-5m-G39]MBL6800368.1 hypothetical protein [Synechococcus sp. BS307-5m-G37]
MIALVRRLAGPAAAATGVLGLAVSGTVWNFYGRLPGLSGTIASLLVLAVGLVLLRPLPAPEPTNAEKPAAASELAAAEDSVASGESLTTAEAIARELAEEESRKPEVVLVTYAPENLLPGTTLPVRKRRPGVSFNPYREMTEELFKSS